MPIERFGLRHAGYDLLLVNAAAAGAAQRHVRAPVQGQTVKVTGNYSADDKPFDQILKVERTGDDAMTMEGKRYHRCPN